MTASGDSACRDKESFHLAVAQSPAGLKNGSSARLDWLEHQLNAHAADKFDMLVLPELVACVYNIGDKVVAVAEPANGPIAIQISKLARHTALRGADVSLVPTALGYQWGWMAHQMIPIRGFENGVFLAYANHAGMEEGLSYLGASFVAAPDIIVAPIEKSRATAAQSRLPYH